MSTVHLEAYPEQQAPGVADRFRAAVAAARAVPGSLPPFWIACAITLVVAHYQLWGRLNIVYKIMSTVVVIMMPFTAGFIRLISHPAVIWLLVFEVVMVVNMIVDRYYTVASLFTTASAPMILIRSLPLMLCGYTLARHRDWQRRVLLFVATVYWLFAIPDARGFIAGARSQMGRAEQYAHARGLEDTAIGGAYVGAYTYFAPLMLFLAIGLCRLYPSLSKRWLLFTFAMQSTFVTVAALSGFGAMAVMVFLTIVFLTLYAPVKTFGRRAYFLAIGVSLFAAFELARQWLVAVGSRGAASDAFGKFTRLLVSIFSGGQSDAIAATVENASSSRSALVLTSLETFKSNLIVGHGFSGEFDLAVGGHSFLADTAAIFGLLGLVPILMFFGLIVYRLRRARVTGNVSWPVSSSTIFVLVLLVGLVMNPYFLGLLSLSYVLFLLLGFALADAEAGNAARQITALPTRMVGPHPVGPDC